MSGTKSANPIWDTVGSAVIGPSVATGVVTLAVTNSIWSGVLLAGETYRIWGNQDFCFEVYPVVGDAVAATVNSEEVGAKIPEWYTPEVDSKLAVITPSGGDTGYVKVTQKKRVS